MTWISFRTLQMWMIRYSRGQWNELTAEEVSKVYRSILWSMPKREEGNTKVNGNRHNGWHYCLCSRSNRKGMAWIRRRCVFVTGRKDTENSATSVSKTQMGANVVPASEDDENAIRLDFALWKSAKPNEISWNSPWGKDAQMAYWMLSNGDKTLRRWLTIPRWWTKT